MINPPWVHPGGHVRGGYSVTAVMMSCRIGPWGPGSGKSVLSHSRLSNDQERVTETVWGDLPRMGTVHIQTPNQG